MKSTHPFNQLVSLPNQLLDALLHAPQPAQLPPAGTGTPTTPAAGRKLPPQQQRFEPGNLLARDGAEAVKDAGQVEEVAQEPALDGNLAVAFKDVVVLRLSVHAGWG